MLIFIYQLTDAQFIPMDRNANSTNVIYYTTSYILLYIMRLLCLSNL